MVAVQDAGDGQEEGELESELAQLEGSTGA